MAKDDKHCKKCGKSDEDCSCPKKAKKGSYGLGGAYGYGHDEQDHQNPDDANGTSEGGGSMGESFAQTQVRKAAAETRSLAKFKEKAEAAKKRQADKDTLHKKLYSDRKTKGIRFSDAKGKGYIKDGKKSYDA